MLCGGAGQHAANARAQPRPRRVLTALVRPALSARPVRSGESGAVERCVPDPEPQAVSWWATLRIRLCIVGGRDRWTTPQFCCEPKTSHNGTHVASCVCGQPQTQGTRRRCRLRCSERATAESRLPGSAARKTA